MLQPECIHCSRIAFDGLCVHCRDWKKILPPLCGRCGSETSASIHECGTCLRRGRHFPSTVRSVYWLTDSARAFLHQLKYHRHFELQSMIKESLRDCEWNHSPESILIPVPAHASQVVHRGFHLPTQITQLLCQIFGLEANYTALKKKKRTLAQSSLSAKERRGNLGGAMICSDSEKALCSVILIDDVFTTGETLRACCLSLLKWGAVEVHAWTLFRTPVVKGI